MGALITALVFLLILTTIVAVHEGGHALVARLCGVRVTEFFIGMPWGPEVSHTGRRSGIRYGATFALLGGYTRIAGMDAPPDGRLARVLSFVNRRGQVTAAEVADEVGCAPDEAVQLLEQLFDWGSIERDGTRRAGYVDAGNATYRTVARDPAGLTVRDRGHEPDVSRFTAPGRPYDPGVSPREFLDREKSRTYAGVGFCKRLAILLAGIAFNLATAFVVGVLYFTVQGVAYVPAGVAEVEPGSPAAAIGMVAGDEIVSIDGVPASTYDRVGEALASVVDPSSVEIAYRHGSEVTHAVVDLSSDGRLGVRYGVVQRRLSVGEASRELADVIAQTASALSRLLVPSQAAEVIEGSSGIVGVAAITGQAVEGGPWSVLILWALLSVSIGLMNLLPIPPLDGGKILIEIVQVVIGRPVPRSVQGAVSLAGMAALLMLFVVVTTQDVTRLLAG